MPTFKTNETLMWNFSVFTQLAMAPSASISVASDTALGEDTDTASVEDMAWEDIAA